MNRWQRQSSSDSSGKFRHPGLFLYALVFFLPLCVANCLIAADYSPVRKLLGITPEKEREFGGIDLFAQSEGRQKFITTLEEQGTVEEFSTQIRHADGHLVPVLVSAWPQLNSEGRAVGYQGYVRNLSDQVQAQKQPGRADKLELIAAMDPLTRTYNRRYFQDVAEREIARSLRGGSHLALIMIDIDHFKKVNDLYGHLVGDDILAAIAGLLRENIRESDVLARFGGEEFVILMPDSSVDQAGERAEGLRQFVARKGFQTRAATALNITVSMGVTAFQKNDTPDSLLERADRALYRSRSDGRNKISVFTS